MPQCATCGRELQFAQDGNSFCPECELAAAEANPKRRPGIAEYLARFPATTTLIAINILIFAAMLSTHVSAISPTVQQLIRWGADSGDKVILHRQWWRIVTSVFVHIGAAHLVMNMWALWLLGTLAETVLGTWLYVAAYFTCGIAGSLTSLYWNPLVVGAGASGALMGILGAVISVLKFARLPLPKEVLRTTVRSLVQGAVLTLVIGVLPRIDNAAHIGGLLCGLLIGLLLSWTRRAGYTLQRPLRRLALLGPLLCMVPLGLAVQRHGEPWAHWQIASEELDNGHYDRAEKEARIAQKGLRNRTAVLEVLSEALFYEGNDGEAGVYLRQLLAQNPRNEFALNLLARIELKDDDAIGARDLLTKFLPSQPSNAYGEVYLGRALQSLNEDKEALAHYRRALQIDSNFYEAELGLATLYEKHDRPKDAILLYQKAAESHPNDLEPLRGLARAYLAAGMKSQADQVIQHIQKDETTGNRVK